jgi:hypothetical protein
VALFIEHAKARNLFNREVTRERAENRARVQSKGSYAVSLATSIKGDCEEYTESQTEAIEYMDISSNRI